MDKYEGTHRQVKEITFIMHIPGMVNLCLTSHKYWHITERRHRWSVKILATILSATSFWKVKVSFTRPYLHGPLWEDMAASQRIKRGVETLNGKLPIIWMLGGANSHGCAKSFGIISSMLKLSTSPW